MSQDILFLDYLWDLKANYFHIKNEEADLAFNRPLICCESIDEIFISHLNQGNVFIDTPIFGNQLNIGLTDRGGAIWESFYDVNWSKFIYLEVNSFGVNNQEFAIFSQTDSILDVAISAIGERLDGVVIMEEWSPTYWKKLKKAYVFKFVVDKEEEDLVWSIFNKCNFPAWRKEF